MFWANVEFCTLITAPNEAVETASAPPPWPAATPLAAFPVNELPWKVIVVLDRQGQGAADVTSATRVIGVIMPNDDSQIDSSDSWQSYRVAVRTIESQTGLDFLSDVAAGVQDAVETRVDNQ